MKGLLLVLLNVVSVIGLTVAAYAARGFYTVGGEVLLIAGIACGSMVLAERAPKQDRQPVRGWLKIES